MHKKTLWKRKKYAWNKGKNKSDMPIESNILWIEYGILKIMLKKLILAHIQCWNSQNTGIMNEIAFSQYFLSFCIESYI